MGLDQAAMASPAPEAVKPASVAPIVAFNGSADPQFWGAVAQAAANAAAGAVAAAVVAAALAPKSSSSSSGGPATGTAADRSGDAQFDVAS
ncbi:hypothetical protein [Actinoplanes sp. SE50/110]|uniref:hypothetical protein n=1 Tax=Actinoplanes sp. (strain ATCC 31044 / CBS 674.73 / SE50/110) TaxID=134676 RepID=UPI0012BAEF1C|nr:hypothetical protein [Actinoplanes sp. SE50/110]